MKILVVHNFYQIAGGEDSVFSNEIELLKQNGHEIVTYVCYNSIISNVFKRLHLVLSSIFSLSQYKNFKKVLQLNKPDVVHVHNYFPLISPSIFYACKKESIPVVHTLHNFRPVCPTSLLMHKGKINEKSINGSAWWSVREKVYRDSYLGTFVVACMVEFHKSIGTWQSQVNKYIALTNFAQHKYIEAGWPAEKIVVKPNFISDPSEKTQFKKQNNNYAIYVGRIGAEKGIDIILDSWKNIDYPIKILGDGPEKSLLETTGDQIEYLGLQTKEEVIDLVSKASFLVMASTWYEGLPMVLVEAFACGTCAVVPKLGGMAEVVEDGVTGLHFEPRSADDLQKKVNWLLKNPESINEMCINARQEYLDKYTATQNYQMLIDIYKNVIKEAKEVK